MPNIRFYSDQGGFYNIPDIPSWGILIYSGYPFLFRPGGFYNIPDIRSNLDQGVLYSRYPVLFRPGGVLQYGGYPFLFRPGGSTIFQISVLIQTREIIHSYLEHGVVQCSGYPFLFRPGGIVLYAGYPF